MANGKYAVLPGDEHKLKCYKMACLRCDNRQHSRGAIKTALIANVLNTPTNIIRKQFATLLLSCRQALFRFHTRKFKTSCRVVGICAGYYISVK
jgi:hypothetical protein